jgi:hypothetical protein
VDRRDFLSVGGQTLTLAIAAGASGPQQGAAVARPSRITDALETRVAATLQAYDAQGNHRTGTDVDAASAEWLADQVRATGLRASLEKFSLNRIDTTSCYLRVGDRRVDGVPLFDGGFTSAEGIRGTLGPLGSGSVIGVAETTPFTLDAPGAERRGQFLEAQRSRHEAVVLLTGGNKPGLFLMNAPSFLAPVGPPMLQVSSSEGDWLKDAAARGEQATVAVHAERVAIHALNVTSRIAGRDRSLAPIILVAPRSAWWQSVSEQGSRLVCWLEAMRVLAAGAVARECLFVAPSGHELGFLGMQAYLRRRPELPQHSRACVFFGSSIGEPGQPNQLYASDETLLRTFGASMAMEGLDVDTAMPVTATARGEAGIVQRGGGRVITIACGSDAYHNAADRWPEAVDVTLLARYARAFAAGALELAQTR